MNPRSVLANLPRFGSTRLMSLSATPNQRARVAAYSSTAVVGIHLPPPGLVGAAEGERRHLAVEAAAADGAAGDEVVVAPAVVGAVAVGLINPSKARSGERGHRVAHQHVGP